MVEEKRHVVLYGGTFDPIHLGHLNSMLELQALVAPERFVVIPCHRPPHRGDPGCSALQRLAMVKLALLKYPQLRVDDREIRRDTISYTVDTLAEFRRELGAAVPLSWVLGSDAFALLHTWHRWRDLLTLAHLIVLQRPDCPLPSAGEVAALLRAHRVDSSTALTAAPAGCIWPVTLTPYAISATAIRAALAAGQLPGALLPDAVSRYIAQQNLYRYHATNH